MRPAPAPLGALARAEPRDVRLRLLPTRRLLVGGVALLALRPDERGHLRGERAGHSLPRPAS
eukprot:4321785-Pyramimonas_sp.AAC.1